MAGNVKLMTSAGGGVVLDTATTTATDVTVKVPVTGVNNGTLACTDANGNLGLGVTPSAWGTTNSLRAIEMTGGSLWGYSTTAMSINQNAYLDGTNYIYKTNAAATRYTQLTEIHLETAGITERWMPAQGRNPSCLSGAVGETRTRTAFATTA